MIDGSQGIVESSTNREITNACGLVVLPLVVIRRSKSTLEFDRGYEWAAHAFGVHYKVARKGYSA